MNKFTFDTHTHTHKKTMKTFFPHFKTPLLATQSHIFLTHLPFWFIHRGHNGCTNNWRPFI